MFVIVADVFTRGCWLLAAPPNHLREVDGCRQEWAAARGARKPNSKHSIIAAGCVVLSDVGGILL
jgi:hypothetical protein